VLTLAAGVVYAPVTSGPVQVIPESLHDDPFAATVTMSAAPVSPSESVAVHENWSLRMDVQVTVTVALSGEA